MATDTGWSDPWQSIAEGKRADREGSLTWKLASAPPPPPQGPINVTGIPASSEGILEAVELGITASDAPHIVQKIAAGEWSAEQVTVAFCKRASIAQQLVNCLTEIMFSDAIQRAKELDATFKATGKVVGPLHGLPISLKDGFRVKGYDATLGFIAWSRRPVQEEESVIVKILRVAGAVLYCKTNIPTALMSSESFNHVWDRTLNPYNRNLSPGGSSGGEGALLALKGSPLGVGTDIAGSVRIPSTCCGVFALKPSFGRFPTYGMTTAVAGQEAVRSLQGPMARSIAALELFGRVVVNDGKPWLQDPNMLPIPWVKVKLPEKLCFGVIRHDGVIGPHPPVQRAVEMVVRALKDAGHETIDFEPYHHETSESILNKFLTADGGESLMKISDASGEPLPAMLQQYDVAPSSGHYPGARSTYEMWKVQADRTKYCKEYLDRWMATWTEERGREMDFIIMPTSPSAAPPHTKSEYLGYTSVWNTLDWSVATVPVLRADPSGDDAPSKDFLAYSPLSERDGRIHRLYAADPGPSAFEGGPVAVQVVGRRLEEEKVLEGCKVVQAALEATGWSYDRVFNEGA